MTRKRHSPAVPVSDPRGNPVSAGSEPIVIDTTPTHASSAVAVVGASCCFPGGATDPERLWRRVAQGADSGARIPPARWDALWSGAADATDARSAFPRWGGFIDDVDAFDAEFFGISKAEAESMDPQQRKMLELTWAAVEDAGYDPRGLDGRHVGVFVGAHGNDYLELALRRPESMRRYGAYLDSGLHVGMIANRVSRWFGFHGPSEVINTACSSSLVALHHACEALQRGTCELAVAAGINLILGTRVYLASSAAGMLASDGRCKTFSRDADGFVRAEGAGVVLLKPYARAREDGDAIYAAIRGTAVNHDGQSQSLRAPNLGSQTRLIRAAYAAAGVPIDTVTYIEAHGTGTSLGDPIEVQALRDAFDELAPDASGGCGLGSVKTHIGHCESAGGIAGLITVLMAMKHGALPGVRHFAGLNPYLNLAGSPLYVVEQTQPWSRRASADGGDAPRRAGISAFGFGGANAHAVLEEHVEREVTPAADPHPVLIVLSARTEDRLREVAAALVETVVDAGDDHPGLPALAYTLQAGRAAMAYRLALRVESLKELRVRLSRWLDRPDAAEDVGVAGPDRRAAAGPSDGGAAPADAHLLEQWLSGAPVDWAPLYKDGAPGRVRLPTYPFARTRYWLHGLAPPSRTPSGPERAAPDSSPGDVDRPERALPSEPDALDEVLHDVGCGAVSVDDAIRRLCGTPSRGRPDA